MSYLSARHEGGTVLMVSPGGTVHQRLTPEKAREWGEDFLRWPVKDIKALGRDILHLAGLAGAELAMKGEQA